MKEQTRRSLIIGAGLAAIAPKLVRAQSIVEIPWNMKAAQTWATEEFNEHPGCRLKFSDGSSYRWMSYTHLYRQARDSEERTYAVAIEVCVTDAKGRRSVNTIPVDGYDLTRGKEKRWTHEVATRMRGWASIGADDAIPF